MEIQEIPVLSIGTFIGSKIVYEQAEGEFENRPKSPMIVFIIDISNLSIIVSTI